MSNFEDERQFARDIHTSNHVPEVARRLQAGQSEADYKAMWKPSASAGTLAAATTATMGYIQPQQAMKVSAPTPPDSELMIQMLDRLCTRARELSQDAGARLDQFARPVPAVIQGTNPSVDTRQCVSSYFRILESRVEMLSESLAYLEQTINSVSAANAEALR